MTKLVSLPLTDDLVDDYINLTAGNLIRRSDATYVNTSGVLSYSRGTRTNLWTVSEPVNTTGFTATNVTVDAYSWPNTISSGYAVTFNTTAEIKQFTRAISHTAGTIYVVSAYVKLSTGLQPSCGSGASDNFRLMGQGSVSLTTGPSRYTYTLIGDGVYRVSAYFTAISTASLSVGVYRSATNSATAFVVSGFQFEALPSGNVIGSDLMDQEQLGSELVTNGTFAAWTGDNPDGWTVSGESGSDPMVTQVSGTARMYASASTLSLTQNILTVDKVYYYTFTITVTSGSVRLTDAATGSRPTGADSISSGGNAIFSTSGTKSGYFIATSTGNFRFQLNTAPLDVIIDIVSVKEVTAPAKGSFHGTAMLAGSTELITNGGFETAAAGGDAPFGTWVETIGGSDTITDETGAGDFYLGAHSAKLTNVDSGTTYVQQSITTTALKLYKLTFYTKGDVAGRYQVIDLTADPDADIVAATATGVTGATWTKVTKYFYTPTSCVSVGIRLLAPASAGYAFYDYVSVRQVQTTWTRNATNAIEIDETVGTGGALKYTGDNSNASVGLLYFADANDMSSNLTVGETYQVSFKAAVSAAGSVDYRIVNSAGVAAITTVTGTTLTTKTLYFKADHASTNYLNINNVGLAEVAYLDDLTIKSVPDLAYLSPGTYTATSGSTATIPAEPRYETRGLLVEGEATNLLPYSYDFTEWANIASTDTTGEADPFGGTSASKIVGTAADTSHGITYTPSSTFPDSTNHVFSVFVKAGARSIIFLQFRDKNNSSTNTWFTLTGSGSVGTNGNDASGISALGSGWYRCWIMNSTATGTTAPRVNIYGADNNNDLSYLADNSTTDFYIYGAQLEATAFPTSYIPTNGCPVTRLTEAGSATNGYSWTMSAALKNALGTASPSRGTLLVDWTPGWNAAALSADAGIVHVADQPASLLYNATALGRLLASDDAGTISYTPGWSANTNYVIAVRWDSTVVAPTTGAKNISMRAAGTWGHGTATNYDGAFTLGTKLRLAYGNEYPFWIKNIRFVDYFALDAPAAFTFTDVTGAFLSTVYTSNVITNTSIDAVISIVGGTYSINGGAYTAAAGIIGPDDTVTVRVTSSANPLTAVSAVLTIGAQSDTYTVTTMSVGAGFLQGMRMVLGGFAPSEKVN